MTAFRPGSFFRFFSREHAGAVVLIAIAFFLAVLPRMIRGNLKPAELGFAQDSSTIAALMDQENRRRDSLRQLRYGPGKAYANPSAYKRGSQSAMAFSAAHPLEINSADSSHWVQLKGIGPVYARRILAFRRALGGFYSKNQLLETRGIDTAVLKAQFSILSVNTAAVKRLQVSAENRVALEKHPYLNRSQASALIAYKKQHGRLTAADLSRIPVFTHGESHRLLPYLALDSAE